MSGFFFEAWLQEIVPNDLLLWFTKALQRNEQMCLDQCHYR
jgi:hypothetical protein